MSYRLCIDIGGTFTDLVVADQKGKVDIFKSPTTPGNYTDAFVETVKMAADQYHLPLKEFMAQCSTIEAGTSAMAPRSAPTPLSRARRPRPA